MLVDTHAHIHSADYPVDPVVALEQAKAAGVHKIVVVGTDEHDSQRAVDFADAHDNVWAAVGLHPHEVSKYTAKQLEAALSHLGKLAGNKKVVAIGECGLDFYYNDLSHLPAQEEALRYQINLAQTHDLPMIFHVREAFSQFWRIFDDYKGLKGVIHSFSSGQSDINHIYSRGLKVGLNGIMTFSRNEAQLDAARTCPQDAIVLETDSPYLTPVPKRGKINEPANVRLVSSFLSQLRGVDEETFAQSTTRNAEELFRI